MKADSAYGLSGISEGDERTVRTVNARSCSNMSIIFAVSNVHGLLRHEIREGGYRSEHFNSFLASCSEQATGRQVVFICDNAPSHGRAHDVVLQESHSVRYQPPYSPFFNLCEGCFSVWKAAVKRLTAEVRDQLLQQTHQMRMATMVQLAEQAVSDITIGKVRNFHNHILSVLLACLLGDEVNVH